LKCVLRVSTEFSINIDFDSYHTNKKDILNYEYDYCDIDQSRLAVFIIDEIRKYINKRNNGLINNINSNTVENTKTCSIMNDHYIEYVNYFDEIEEINKASYGTYKCSRCQKKFKSKELLYLHYKLFHLSSEKNNSSLKTKDLDNLHKDDYICPADLCIILNCKRYKNYLNLKKEEKKVLKYKNLECNHLLENFYRKMCMKLIDGCFVDRKDQFYFYKIFCENERCEISNNTSELDKNILFKANRDEDHMSVLKKEYNIFSELPKEGSIFLIFYNIFLYLVSILSFIYIIIIWITKNN